MKFIIRHSLLILCLALLWPFTMEAQEHLTGVMCNPVVAKAYKQAPQKGTRDAVAVKLPFVEEFSNYTGYPNDRLWMDRTAFVNSTYCINPPSMGVATLDALDEQGRVYAHAERSTFAADTLTSALIRLDSNFTQNRPMRSSDSVYFSFYYQPGGGCSGSSAVEWERIGDAPEHDDELVLEFGYATGNMVFVGYYYAAYYIPAEEHYVAGDTMENPYMPGTIYIFESNAFGGEIIMLPADSLFGPEYVWNQVWSSNGCNLETWLSENPLQYFKQVLIPITDEQYFRNNFQFRFRNYASLDLDSWSGNNIVGWSSNCDQWNIDYIQLDINRTADDIYPSDVAFVAPTTTALSQYQSMPWHQYRATDMAPEFHNSLSNLSNTTQNVGYQYTVEKNPGGQIYYSIINFINATPYSQGGLHTYTPHATPSIDYAYTYDGADSASFTITHLFRMEGTNDKCKANDTCRFEQKFYNYYAYDDGTAEAGYSLLSTMSDPVSLLAVQFTLAEPDTLRCVRMWFNSALNDENFGEFTLMVWDDDNGLPGNVIYSLPAQYPKHGHEFLDFVNYYPEEPVPISGTFYVGFMQEHNIQLNIGFDQNNDARGHFFYSINDFWHESFYKGAPMIRPVVGKAYDHSGIVSQEKPVIKVYPNPTTSIVHFDGLDETGDVQFRVSDLYGRTLNFRQNGNLEIDFSDKPAGIYFVTIIQDNHVLKTEKIIKH